MTTPFSFTLLARHPGSPARAGLLTTPHGDIPTPMFMPVGTLATVKSLDPADLLALDAPIILANTYHLYLRPGADVVAAHGGLHDFMGWPRAILTDSGGFQVFSLGHMRKLDDAGVTFRSHIDGSTHVLTPEKVIAIEEALGADIILPLDVCTALPATRESVRAAMGRTTAWAERALAAKQRPDQWLFGIPQGGAEPDLRAEHARTIAAMGFPGFSIGGLSVGEPKAQMWAMVEATVPHLSEDRPRHLLGVGSPEDLVEGIARGIDLFDCVLPTRVARNGALFTPSGRINLRNAAYERQLGPVDPACSCATCARFSAAYLHHLFRCEELLGYRLATVHNLHFMLNLARRARAALLAGTFAAFQAEFLAAYTPVEEEAREDERQRRGAPAQGRGPRPDRGP